MTVNRGLGRFSARQIPPQRARRMIEEGGRQPRQHLGAVGPYVRARPTTITILRTLGQTRAWGSREPCLPGMMQKVLIREYEARMPTFKIAGRRFHLEHEQVELVLASVAPEPIQQHYVIVRARRYPPKQALSCLTGLDRADFTTHQARRILRRLGFVAARRTPAAAPGPEPGRGRFAGRQAEALRPYAGRWVALGEEPDEVIADGATAREVVAWLYRHRRRAQGVFRVPLADEEPGGLAPL